MIETTNLNNEDVTDVNSIQLGTSQSTLVAILSNPYLHAAILVVIVGLCFGRTLTSYFLADDFGEISYVSRIFNGEPQLFWSNFTGNYMQIPGMNVYRPWLLVSLVLDFLAYRANAAGYYFTNLAFFTGDVLLIYAIARQLTNTWTRVRSAVAALFGAALFAANPLRCESVSWVVGRVDIVCCFFYLTSYLLFLKSRIASKSASKMRLLVGLGVLSFFLAMGTKEMAIGLPALLFVTEFFDVTKSDSKSESILQRGKDALVFSAPIWVSTIVYFVIRYVCLGTLGGGYVAGFGASQMSFMFQRWLDPDTLKRLFFPLCSSLFAQQTSYRELLTACYTALAGIGLIRLFDKKLSLRWALFLAAWMVTAAVPIFQLWGLGFDLEGSRFYFFLSIPICLAAPLLLFRPTTNRRSSAELKLLVATAVVFTATAAILGRVAALTDLEWVHAGKENRQVSTQAQKLAETEHLALIPVLGIPKERNGAHQLLNGSTFNTMLAPPFTKTVYAAKFQTFDPIMFGPPEYIDPVRFLNVLRKTGGVFFVWNKDSSSFDRKQIQTVTSPIGAKSLPIQMSAEGWLPQARSGALYEADGDVVKLTHLQDGDGLRLTGQHAEPASVDFLEFEYEAAGVPGGAQFKVFAQGKQQGESEATANMQNADQFKTVRIPLSRYWKWYCLGEITSLVVQPSPCQSVSMRNFRLLSADSIAPQISASSDASIDSTGVAHFKDKVAIRISERKLNGATKLLVEVGKVNFFFNNFEKVSDASPVGFSIATSKTSKSLQIPTDKISQPGFYEIRARYLDSSDNPIGEFSNIVTLRIGKAQAISQ